MVIPSPHQSDTVVEPYNFIMGLGDLKKIKAEKFVVGFDNEQLYQACELQGIDEPGYNQINRIIGKTVAVLTSPYRIRENPGQLSEMLTNLLPYEQAFLVSPTLSFTNDISKL